MGKTTIAVLYGLVVAVLLVNMIGPPLLSWSGMQLDWYDLSFGGVLAGVSAWRPKLGFFISLPYLVFVSVLNAIANAPDLWFKYLLTLSILLAPAYLVWPVVSGYFDLSRNKRLARPTQGTL
ncbi:MAG: hypothetical protein WBK28_02705 [Minisyncoccia bacterium]